MSVQVFADESQARGLLVAAVTVPCSSVGSARTKVGSLKLKGQERIHFYSEKPERRRYLLAEFLQLPIDAVIYDASGHGDQKEARIAAITRLAQGAASNGTKRLVLDRHVAADRDREIISKELAAAGRLHDVSVHHMQGKHECLLALPDAVAWCYAKGGEWRRLVSPLVTNVIRVLAVRTARSPAGHPSGRLPGSLRHAAADALPM